MCRTQYDENVNEPIVLTTSVPNPTGVTSACPYYLAQALAKQSSTELILCPYNYVLDSGIRKAMGIEDSSGERLARTIVVLDEAHNVEVSG